MRKSVGMIGLVYLSLFLLGSGCEQAESVLPTTEQTQQEAAVAPANSNVQNPNYEVVSVASGQANAENIIQGKIVSNKELFFPKGVYNISKTINISNVQNLKIRGEEGTIFQTSNLNKIFLISGNISSLSIQGVSFKSTKSSTVHDPEGLIFIANYGDNTMAGITIQDCQFSNPATHCNGIKMVSEGNNAMVRNLYIRNNKFQSIGRMGIEFQNHNTSPVRVRYQDYEITGNTFNDIGTIQNGPAPCCVSVSGYSLNGKINQNTFNEMRMNTASHIYYGIENAGTIGLETNNNTFNASTYGFTGILGSNPTREAAAKTGQPLKKDWVIKGNVMNLKGRSDNSKIRGIEIADCEGVEITNNKITSDGYALRFIYSRNAKVYGNTFTTLKANNVVYFHNNSSNNQFYNNTITGNVKDNAAVVFFQSSGNNVYGNTLVAPGNVKGSYWGTTDSKNTIK